MADWGKWQKCPSCSGRNVSGGYFIKDDAHPYWTATNALKVCQVCGGTGLIRKLKKEVKE